MLLFPYIFGRSGGASISKLQSLEITESLSEDVKAIIAINATLEDYESTLINLLFEAISNEKNNKIQNKLLNLKRDIFNHKNLTSYIAVLEENFNGTELYNFFLLYWNQLKTKRDLVLKGQQLYAEHANESLLQLQLIFRDPHLRNGILFSSEKLDGVLSKKAEDFIKQKKKDIFSILKYATRSLTKTTPFSTFSKTFCLKRVDDIFTSIEANQSVITINNFIFLYVKKLILSLPNVKIKFLVSVNSSMTEENGCYKFLVNIENNDSLTKIKQNPVCNYIKELVQDNNKIVFFDLMKIIAEQTEETWENTTHYLNELIKTGFLQLHFPVSIYDAQWHLKLTEHLKSDPDLNDNQIIPMLISFLEKLEITRLSLLNNLVHHHRKFELTHILHAFNELKKTISVHCPQLIIHDSFNALSVVDLYYEDYFDNQHSSALTDIDLLVEELKEMQSKLSVFNERQFYKQKLIEIIKTEFHGDTRISLISFFEIFCTRKDDIKAKLEADFAALIQNKDSLIMQLLYAIDQCNANEVIDLKKVLTSRHVELSTEGFGLYYQVCQDDNTSICVINNESYGWGKNISRFLGFYNEAITHAVGKSVQEKFADCIIADVHDASVHNTNIYPKLTDYLIDIAGSEEDNRGYTKISLSELFIDVCEENIYLTWRNKKILPVHFSMENIERKSSLVKLLDIFSVSMVSNASTIRLLGAALRNKFALTNEDTVVIPRLLYGNTIVVERKKWLVKKSLFINRFAKKIGDEQSFHSYTEIIKWKNQIGLPDEVFVKMAAKPVFPKKLHKPQYVNFKIPLLVECFLSMIEEADEIIEISEMLPSSTQIETTDNEKYVKEYILNIA